MISIIKPFTKISHFLAANLIAGIGVAFISVQDPFNPISKLIIGTLWGALIFATQWLGHAYLQGLIARRYTWLESPMKRLFLTIIAVVFYTIFAFIIVQTIMNYLVFKEIPYQYFTLDMSFWAIPLAISVFISLLMAAIGFFTSLKKEISEKEVIKREMLTYKYEVLRNQINPHFMFNSLNVLSDLVYDDQKLAVKFIHQFSDIYRYVLDSRDKELIPLKEELLFIEKFVFLLKIRFEEKLNVIIDLDEKKEGLIVPLALQLLIENAVKHNEVSKKNPLTIKIIQSGDRIAISNMIQLKNIGDDSKQIGLKNLRQQFSYFSNEEVVISEKENQFMVTIPILKEEV